MQRKTTNGDGQESARWGMALGNYFLFIYTMSATWLYSWRNDLGMKQV